MLNITDKTQCCGCGACQNICPKGAISMTPDEEGFLYPSVNFDVCVKCGLCLKVCPVTNKPPQNTIKSAYAAKAKEDAILSASSSGGMFSLFALEVLKRGGIVFGAGYDKDWNVVHSFARNAEELDNLRRSKYVQSDIGETFKEVKEFLAKGLPVMFTGTPCQIAGLKNYLGVDSPFLFCAEIICHSVPSPAVWREYLKTFKTEDLSAVNFRDKHSAWDKSYLRFYFKDGRVLPYPSLPAKYLAAFCERINIKYFFTKYYTSPFTKAFLASLITRPACHACAFKGGRKEGDITMGDMWGFSKVCPDMYDAKGLSLLFINSAKGQIMFDAFKDKMVTRSVNVQEALKYNPYALISAVPHPKRQEFFARFRREPLNSIINDILPEQSFLSLIIAKIKNKLS